MAFQKDDAAETGFAATGAYHRIGYVRGDPMSPAGLDVFVYSYKSRADRIAGAKPFRRREFNGIVINWGAGAPGAQLYAQIRESIQNESFFSDANNVLD